jgi:glycosyltransferase involved in cell wall biosynthesis/GT2 family glycosyltransferase
MFRKVRVVAAYARLHGLRRTAGRIAEEFRGHASAGLPAVTDRVLRLAGGAPGSPGGVRVLLCGHVASEKLFGGERSFLDLAEGLRATGATVFAALPKGAAPAYLDELRRHVAAVFVLPYGWWDAAEPEDERCIADFCAIIAQEGITLLHANTIMLREPLSAARRMAIPGITHVRELVAQDPALCARIGLSPEAIQAEVRRRADLLVVNSRCTAQAFGGLGPGVALVANTVDFASLSRLPGRPSPDLLRVGMISSNLPKKGLAAFARLAERLQHDPRIAFCLVGPENRHTAAMPPSVRVLGYRATPAAAVAEMDVVLSLSEFQESFGRTVLEAQAAGRPAIVWDRGAPPEILRDGETGRIIPADDIDALVRAVEELASDPAAYDAMARAARSHATAAFGGTTFRDALTAAYRMASQVRSGVGRSGEGHALIELPGELRRSELRASGLFDAAWYLARYPDVALSGLTPEDHFRVYGDAMGRNPGPGFDAQAYLDGHRDLRVQRPAALRHYIRFGRAEQRRITPADPDSLPDGMTRPDPAPAGFASPVMDQPVDTDRIQRHDGQAEDTPGGVRVLLCGHVASEKLFGGERSFLDLAEGLRATGATVFAALPKGAAPAYLDELRRHVAAVFVLPYGWWDAAEPEDERCIADFCAIIAQEGITLLHANTIMLREPLSAARRMAIPGITHVRELVAQDPALCARIGLSPEAIQAEVRRRADLLVVNSRCTAQAFGGLGPGVALVANTVDFASLSRLPGRPSPDLLRVGMISSNLPKKGLAAFARLAERLQHDPRIAFCLVGPENRHTAAMPPSVRVLGYRATPAAAVAEMDVVLSLSEFQESFGRTVLEAQAAGRPAIVWDRGAPPEILRDGETGRIIPADDIDALVRAVEELASDPAAYDAMARAARSHATAAFGGTTFRDALTAAYGMALATHAPARVTLPARTDVTRVKLADLKLAYFVWHFPVRSETFVLNELRLLREQGCDVTVFCKGSPQPDFRPDFDIRWEAVRDSDHLARRLSETGRTMCHAHFVYPTVTEMLWPACEKAGVPFTFIPHAQDIFRYANDEKNRIDEVAQSALCRAVFIPSMFHKDYLQARGVPVAKMILNPNGCDYRRYEAGQAPERATRPFRRVVAIHRFTEKKGLSHLIRAAKHLEADGITVTIHGYGELEGDYRAILRAEKIRNVELHGPVASIDDMLSIFRKSDLFACPSVRAADGDMDGIPTVLMEAMAARLPVLTTGLSGIPDLVEDNLTGIVCNAEPLAIAERIRTFYALSDTAVTGMIEAAYQHVRRNFSSEFLIDTLLRVWTNNRVDLMIVSWNGPAELAEIIRRLRQNTSMPYHLIVCDNGSGPETLALLQKVYAEDPAATIILNRENALVGPGTNICLEKGQGEFAIYVCGKEGMTTGWGWERSFIETMRADPAIGLAGTIGHSPSYLYGRDYPRAVATFPHFRNPDFASRNAERIFGHVQGGFFVIRRAMYEQIGGFSEAVPHNHTDVEYSYYAESCGWTLGTVPGVMALYNKTRPALLHRVDEHHHALHPPTLDQLPALDRIAKAEVKHCNLCGTSSPRFLPPEDEATCPHCGSDRLARTVFRALADSTLLYRRLAALAIDLPPSLEPFWKEQFQGKILTGGDVAQKGSGFANGRLMLVGIFGEAVAENLWAEAARVLAPGGTLMVAGGAKSGSAEAMLQSMGLRPVGRKYYQSRVVDFHPGGVLVYEHAPVTQGFAKAAR